MRRINARVTQCHRCQGSGLTIVFIEGYADDSDNGVEVKCAECDGSGWVKTVVEQAASAEAEKGTP